MSWYLASPGALIPFGMSQELRGALYPVCVGCACADVVPGPRCAPGHSLAVWGMAHVFDGKLCFTRDHMQGNVIPKNLKLPEPKPAPKPRPKASSSGEHVKVFRMVYDRKKSFQAEHL